jgi:hypothetical protein
MPTLVLLVALAAGQSPTPRDWRRRAGCSSWGKYYGGSSHAWEGMAREGRKVGADAVVAVNITFRPSMFSWASPHAEGIAVTWTDAGTRRSGSGPPTLRRSGPRSRASKESRCDEV